MAIHLQRNVCVAEDVSIVKVAKTQVPPCLIQNVILKVC